MKIKTLIHKLSARTQRSLKLAVALVAVVNVVGCSAGNPYVTDADRNEIITLGDSIFDLSGEIQANLEQNAGQTFRDYTLSGAELNGGLLAKSVAQQYIDAKADDANIVTIVMDGGGNDILIPAILFDPYGCKTHWWRWSISRSCKGLVDDIYVEGVNMLNEIDADGVQNVIYLGYYHTAGLQSNLAQAVDYGDKRLSEACANTTANCSYIDPRGSIVSSDIIGDGIHPNSSGSQKLADLIWPQLQPLL